MFSLKTSRRTVDTNQPLVQSVPLFVKEVERPGGEADYWYLVARLIISGGLPAVSLHSRKPLVNVV